MRDGWQLHREMGRGKQDHVAMATRMGWILGRLREQPPIGTMFPLLVPSKGLQPPLQNVPPVWGDGGAAPCTKALTPSLLPSFYSQPIPAHGWGGKNCNLHGREGKRTPPKQLLFSSPQCLPEGVMLWGAQLGGLERFRAAEGTWESLRPGGPRRAGVCKDPKGEWIWGVI